MTAEILPNNRNGVHVITTARLHMGFFDLNGGLGRKFGSIGVSLSEPATELQAFKADGFSVEGQASAHQAGQRALSMAKHLATSLDLEGGVHLNIQQLITEHAGLGSGTQLALAVGLAMSQLYSLDLTIKDIALMTQRGARSGIGLGTFAAGGVIIDGGRAEKTEIPPVIARAEFPEEWRIILIYDHGLRGVHGNQEVEAFRSLPEFSAESAAKLCRYVLMQALPALAEKDLHSFGLAIRELQQRTGDHFAPAQGGRYASKKVSQILEWLETQGVQCMGQSSWGPTGFAIFADELKASQLLADLQNRYTDSDLGFMLCKGRNEGALVTSF
ncbi:beta-ribofuranosylaminobenzene 5'-phosphate synthase family protein [Methyloradius palustris]|uniref:Beta-ribofuranosylaminobenzene 5'-phosphate synthase n=1 Tax=Methyloradius palustris TaxID=2778876 RepID=A0A8D5G858_9PROT|nr:beta-ribofuranosylaminobenzene 5'-phosphate synthase family protein [Methyloradius palustris]BCM24922.1 beta-ribofuranosylaminobenzene 5'-phosphate synthase [Methyloradius palustris]